MANICPYPGLRPFNENESIFFKGRDEHIKKIIAQLAKNKFVMITGASGDGKSSLIYAGVIPNAKAGFFKARHNNWIVADFRPERSPVTNMAVALTRQLGYQDQQQVEKELGYGFSSLVDLYTKSEFALDTNAEAFLQADAETQKQSKRKAANLLILVDQFEELFTNAENYSNDQPSIDAQTAVNLLIETSRIALEKDIPIYVVCTMRSDYIGQCSAFRGLPELIGFSQFFVPRLKRKEIQQVIVDPAILSGNRISNRLTQTLINELGDGLDQLPVLQHALNQIWKAAGDGTSEMDLIHLAKAGGLKREQLPEEDKAMFDEWYNTLPEFKKALLKKPSLENILNAHANELYETAHEVYNQTHETPISQQTAQFIIKKAFQGLTKTDQGRTVRNRMTLQEIINVIYSDSITTEMVGAVLDIFRMPGNTFLRPFVNSESEYVSLKSSDLLDITHESLIRNWRLLSSWAGEEYQNILTYRDFKKQTERWKNSLKSSDYLLPIGPLTYFEGWLLEEKPNKYLIAKYDEVNLLEKNKLSNSEYWLNTGQEFINRSARKLFFTRFVMKYGAARIAATLAAFIVVGVGIYLFLDYQNKLNKNVLPKIEEQCFAYLNNKTVKNKEKAAFLINEEILHPGSLVENLKRLNTDTLFIDVANAVSAKVLIASNAQHKILPDFMLPLIKTLNTKISAYTFKDTTKVSESKIARIIEFLDIMNAVQGHHPEMYSKSQAEPIMDTITSYLYTAYVRKIFTDTIVKEFNSRLLLNALKLYMLQHKEDKTNFVEMIGTISPFESSAGAERFERLFPKSVTAKMLYGNEINHKGGFVILATLYSGVSGYENLRFCLDSLYIQNGSFEQNYSSGFGFSEIINFALHFSPFNSDAFEKLVRGYAKTSLLPPILLMKKQTNMFDNFEFDKGDKYVLLKAPLPRTVSYPMWDFYYKLLTGEMITEHHGVGDFADDKTLFLVANYYKTRGLNAASIYKDTSEAINNFEKFFTAFSKISSSFLRKEQVYTTGNTIIKKTNFDVLMYPNDVLTCIELFAYDPTYIRSDFSALLFEKFIIHKGIDRFYDVSSNELLLRHLYGLYPFARIEESDNIRPEKDRINFFYEFVDSVDAFTKRTDNKGLKEEGIVVLYQIERQFREKNSKKALNKMDALGIKKMLKLFKAHQNGYKTENLQKLICNFSTYLALNNRIKESFEVIATLKDDFQKRNGLIENSFAQQISKKTDIAVVYIDSLLRAINGDDKFGLIFLRVLGRQNSSKYNSVAIDLIARLGENKKNEALSDFVWGKAEAGEYYKAKITIPQFLSRDREFKIYNGIITTHVKRLILDSYVDSKNLWLLNQGTESWLSNDWENGWFSEGTVVFSNE